MSVEESKNPMTKKEKSQLAAIMIGFGGGTATALTGFVLFLSSLDGKGCADLFQGEETLPATICRDEW
ncbi:hypothetical protein D3C83_122970 [compost metagenome]